MMFSTSIVTACAVAVIAAVALPLGAGAQKPPAMPAMSSMPSNLTLTAVDGIRVGHFTLSERPTGCSVIVADGEGAVAGVSQRGGAPGTRETNLLDPDNLVERVNAIVLTGGSAYGLDSATGVMRYLEEHKMGFNVGVGVVPIVPAAVLFDLPFGGRPDIRPNADCGYKAASSATSDPVAEGNVGAGAGATVGKMGGFTAQSGAARAPRMPMKAGIGSAAFRLPNGLVVAAIVAVNAVGDIIDPETGQVVAGSRNPDGTLADVRRLLRTGDIGQPRAGENTTIGIVATNAKLTKSQANRMALMADDGIARAISPSHTMGDGDTIFAMATGKWDGTADVTIVGALAADALSEAIVRAAVMAPPSNGLPSARSVGTVPARFK
jgi:L-aminopeptidase/D-esterase-like protein